MADETHDRLPTAIEAARVRKAMEPAWNDLREQRLLGRIQDEKRERLRARPQRSYAWIAVAAALVVGIGGTAAYLHHHANVTAPVASNAAAPPKMLLADGSEAVLSQDARVQIDEQRDDQVRITQSAGEVTYDVVHNPKRQFAVKVRDVTVRVLGTAFTVGLANEKVTVHVLRGKVEVDDGSKKVLLSVGDTLSVAASQSHAATSTSAEPADSVEAPKTAESAPKAAAPTVEQLLAKADEARGAHRYDEAATALRTMVLSYPSDPRVASAYFTLGRVERARGRHAAAAEAFAKCHKVAPHGALAEDALAEEAASWKSAGDASRAKVAAKKYLELHPAGPHVQRMIPLAE